MTLRHNHILLLFFLSSLQNAIGQKDTTIKNVWGQVGLIEDTRERVGIHLGLNYVMSKNVFSIRYYQEEEWLVGFPFKAPRINYAQKIQDLSFMYGISFSSKYFKLIPMVGASVGQGNWRNGTVDTIRTSGGWFNLISTGYVYHYDKFQYIGLHLNLGLLWAPSKYFGIGLDVFENFHLHPDNGIAISVMLGRLR